MSIRDLYLRCDLPILVLNSIESLINKHINKLVVDEHKMKYRYFK